MQGLSDHDLMMAVKNGDLDQLAVLFERYHHKLYNLFFWQTRNAPLSEDLVQDVFIRIIRSRHTYRGEGKFITWMYSIARSARAEHFRKKRHPTRALDQIDDTAMDDPNPEDQTLKKDTNRLLYQALGLLDDEKREVLILSRFQYMKYEEIAEVMQCTVGTVKSRVFWALKDLSQIYKKLSGE